MVALWRDRQSEPGSSFRHWRNVRLVAPNRLERADASAAGRVADARLVRGHAPAGLGVLSVRHFACHDSAVDRVAAGRPLFDGGKTRAGVGASEFVTVL